MRAMLGLGIVVAAGTIMTMCPQTTGALVALLGGLGLLAGLSGGGPGFV